MSTLRVQSMLRLLPSDPTIFTQCDKCCARGRGSRALEYFAKAFTLRDWRKGQTCENCHGELTVLYEVKTDG